MARSVFGDLIIDVDDNPQGVIRLDWRGKSNHRQPDTILTPFFADMTARAVSGQKALEMHFEQLEFFNSSTITAIIQYVKELRDRKVKLTVTFDSRHRWQKIFFDALFIFDKGDGLFQIQSAPTTPVGNPGAGA
ncbi:MAG TPA: hypothetical protein VGI39_34885 [Polyangiaceae bacterium]|jgi:hypothetical protein